jgi:hypothetical protein
VAFIISLYQCSVTVHTIIALMKLLQRNSLVSVHGMFFAADHLARLRQLYDELKTILVASSVARVMYERDALTLSELESITGKKDQGKAVKTLLDILLDQQERATYDCFLESLKQTNQMEIYFRLIYPGGDTACIRKQIGLYSVRYRTCANWLMPD